MTYIECQFTPPPPLFQTTKKNKNKNFLTFDINIYFVSVFQAIYDTLATTLPEVLQISLVCHTKES